MVMNVTQQAQRREGWGTLLAGVFPRSHMNPTKNFGDVLDVRWSVTNNGSVAQSARLVVLNPNATGGVLTQGLLVSVGPGLTVGLILLSPALVNGTHANVGANACRVQMLRDDGALIQEHLFTLTMNAPAGNLVAVGEPTIT